MIEKALKLANIFNKMKWRFLIAPQHIPYLTSDNPVFYFELNKPESQLLFPVSSHVTLSLFWNDLTRTKKWNRVSEQYWGVDDKTVILIRDAICSAAINEVYFSKKPKWLVEYINNRVRQNR